MAYPQQCLNVTASDYKLLLSDITINGFRVSKQNVSIKTIWISLGKQQWGYEITFSSKTIIFPCPYAEIMPSVIGSSSGSSAKLAINANSLISFNASNQAAQTIWWVSIGKQQWGYATTTITLPIVFNNTDYSVALTKADTSSGGAAEAWVAITNKTNDTVTWRGQWTSHINWFAIGRQQKHINSCYSHFRKFEMLCLLLLFQRC